MNREIRNALNSKAPKRILSNAKPAKREGSDGEERIAKSNGGVRLYRKELGQWWYTQFQQSDEKNTSSVGIATANDLGTVKIGSGLSITSAGVLSLTSGSTNYYLDGITKSSNTLTFSVNGATNQTYTFGSNAFNSTTIPTNTNQLTNGAGFLTAVATSNIADEAVTLAKLAHVATDIFLGRTSNGTGDVEAMSVSDVTVLLNLDNYLTSVSTLNADKLTAGTIPDARVPASAVTQHVASIVHDSLSGFVANEHIDWTADQGSTNIHSGNYTDTNTNQLTRFYFVDDDGDSVHPSHNHYIKFMNGTGITTNWDATDSAGTSGDPHILTIASTTNGTVTAVGTSGSIAGGTINTTGTITHLTSAGHSHVPTTLNQSGKFLKAGSNSGLSEAWTSITESDITDLGTYLTTSSASSTYLPKTSPTLTADTTLSMNNGKVSARTSAGGGSDGVGSAGQVLHSHGAGGGVYWGTISSAPSVNIYDGDGTEVNLANKWMKFVEGSDLIDIDFTNTSDGGTDDPYDLTFTINSGNITSVGTLSGLTVNGNVYISEYLRHHGDINTHIRFSADENIEITANDKKMMRFEGNASELVINEDHAQIDFRVESDTLSHILFVDASADRIGVGHSAPSIGLLDVRHTGASTSNDTATLLNLRQLATSTTANLRFNTATNNSAGHIIFNTDGSFQIRTDANVLTTFSNAGGITIGQGGSASNNSIYHNSNNWMYVQGGTAGLALKGENSDDSCVYLNNASQNISLNTNNVNRLLVNNTTVTVSGVNLLLDGGDYQQWASTGTAAFLRKVRQEGGAKSGDIIVYLENAGTKPVIYDITFSSDGGNCHYAGCFYVNESIANQNATVADTNGNVGALTIIENYGTGANKVKFNIPLTGDCTDPILKVEMTTGGSGTSSLGNLSIDIT